MPITKGAPVATTERVRTALPVIDVAGTHLEIGRGIGESLREGLQEVAEVHRAAVTRTLGWERALEITRELIPHAEATVPHCMQELRGMADGSGVELEVLFSANALQEIRFLAGRDAASPNPEDEDDDE
jgi:isopenicillin-N N-acyltransferase-like protein